MRLAATIDIYGGGPGSGCNPEVGKCGRPRTESTRESNAKALAAATTYVNMWHPTFNAIREKFTKLVRGDGIVEGRLKSGPSLAEKVIRKGRPIDTMTDIMAYRVTVRHLTDVYRVAEKLKANFNVFEVDDKIDKGQGGYRALHLLARIDNGPTIELQVRTANQSKWAVWIHDPIYKNTVQMTREQKSKAIQYAVKVSDALYNQDKGAKSSLPKCPSEVRAVELCYDPGQSLTMNTRCGSSKYNGADHFCTGSL